MVDYLSKTMRGVTVLSADASGNLTFTGALNGATGTLRGALTAYNSSGKLLMQASAGRIDFYDGANNAVTGYVDSDSTANTNNIRINGNGLITSIRFVRKLWVSLKIDAIFINQFYIKGHL